MQVFLTEKEVAEQIKVSLASLRRWRLLQRGPRFLKVGALVRYRPEDLEHWMETLPVGGTAAHHKENHLSWRRDDRPKKDFLAKSIQID